MKTGKRVLSLMLACLMCLSLLTTAAWAQEDLPKEPAIEVAEVQPEETLSETAEDAEADWEMTEQIAVEPEESPEPEAAWEEAVDASEPELQTDEAFEQTVYTHDGQQVSVSVENETMDNDDLFYGYMEVLAGGEPEANMGMNYPALDGAGLSGLTEQIYTILQGYIRQVAAGELSSTEFSVSMEELNLDGSFTASDLGVTAIVSSNKITDEATEAMYGKLAFDINALLEMLLATMPYDLYWFDKTQGVSVKYPSSSAAYDGGWKVFFDGEMTFSFVVASAYASETYEVNTSLGQNAQQAAARAKDVVDSYAQYGDYEKLVVYRETICALTGYNDEAAAGNYAYGNPWQLIWVFDDDPSTTVVCEGYAKAFQYLCDLSTFQENISCITVTGTMDGGAHMWNIVNMEDGQNYLVDVTNCDEGSVGAPDLLFLAGGTEISPSLSYAYACEYENVTYSYDSSTLAIYDADQLAMSAEAYVMEVTHVCVFGEGTVTTEPTCTTAGERTYVCSVCGAEKTEILDALGHDYVDHAGQDATCTAVGWYAYKTCTRCDYSAYKEIPATGHSYTDKVTTEPTCTAKGVKTYVCSNCNDSYTEDVAALGHDDREEVVEPTCTEVGYTVYTCDRCGRQVANDYVYSLGHDYQKQIYADEGYIVYTCTRCQESYREDYNAGDLLGDVTNDGAVDLLDVTILFQYVSRQTAALDNMEAADVNGDGSITLMDVTRLFQYVDRQIDTL